MLIFFFSIPMFLVAVFVLGIAGLAFPALRTIIDIGNNIETYHGLTTSKPLQLRCFQSG